MMVETIFESSQDFGMSNGALPQWKRELLQRRAARSRPAAAAPLPPPPPPPPPLPPADDDNNDEELRYGPGIVKRLKSRYLSLALRDAPRRRPSVLRRAASLEHLLDERPPRAPRPARPSSVAAPAPLAPSARRESVKRARSVDALSRLDSCEVPVLPPPPAPPQPPPLPASRPPAPRAARPPRRPAPLLREAERPPPDLVRSTLRKFESAPTRRPAPAARVPAVLRGLEGPRRSLTPERQEPEPCCPSPTDAPDLPPAASPAPPASSLAPRVSSPALPVSSPVPPASSPVPPASSPASPAFSPAPPASPVPPTFSPVPPASSPAPPTPTPALQSTPAPPPPPDSPPPSTPPPSSPPAPSLAAVPPPGPDGGPMPGAEEREAGAARVVPRAALEGIARAGSSVRYAFEAARGGSHLPPLAATNPVLVARRVGVIRPMPASPRDRPEAALVNGHSTPEPRVLSRIGAAGIERAWSGSPARLGAAAAAAPAPGPPWPRAAARARAPPPQATSVVFNFSDRKEVPDYIENDGIILRASRRNRIKAGAAALRPEAARDSDSDSDAADGPASPCAVRFLNDNVLINGRSSMPDRTLRDPHRIAKLKLQFDDSLTRTFEYPSETSLCEEPSSPPPAAPAAAPAPAPAPAPGADAPDAPNAHLADNTHIASAALSRYTPSKTPAAAFQLGVTRRAPPPPPAPPAPRAAAEEEYCVREAESGSGAERGHAVPCGAGARAWSEARTAATDLLF